MYTTEDLIAGLENGSMKLDEVNNRFVMENDSVVGVMDLQTKRNGDYSVVMILVGPFPIISHEVSGLSNIFTLNQGIKAQVISGFAGTFCSTPDEREFRNIIDAINHVTLN